MILSRTDNGNTCCLHTKCSSSMFCGPGLGSGGTGCPVVGFGRPGFQGFGSCVQNRQMNKLHALKNQVPIKMAHQYQAKAKVDKNNDLEVHIKDPKD